MAWAAAGATVEVKVVERESGKPIPGAEIFEVPRDSNAVSNAKVASDANGSGRLELAESSRGARIGVTKAGWCPLRLDLAPWKLDAQPSFVFRMTRAVSIGGEVQDEGGQPVAGAHIAVNFPQSLIGARTPVDDLAAVSGADGKWQADYVPAEAELIGIEVTHPSYKWDGKQPPREALLGRKAILLMRAQHQIAGRVLNPDGQPVPGATVFRGAEYGIMGVDSRTPTATTDKEGRFRFPPDEGGKVQLAAIAAGFGPALIESNVGKEAAPVELVLTAPHTLRVRVTDLEGHPIGGLPVRADAWKSFRYPPWTFTTDAEGRFTFTNAPADRVSMDFIAAGHMTMLMYPLQPGETENVVRLGPELRLHGTVVDAATHQPIAAFNVTPGWPRQAFRNGAVTNEGAEFPANGGGKQFHDGRLDWTFNQPLVVGTEKPYDFMLRVEAEGYAPEVSRIFKATEGEASYDFQLKPAKYLTSAVRLPDGSPAGGAKIYLVRELWELNAANGIPQPRQFGVASSAVVTADPTGRFKMMDTELPPKLVVWHEAGFAQLDTAALRSTPEIRLTRWARIEGTIKRGQAIAPHERVALWYAEQWENSSPGWKEKLPVFYQYGAEADASGRFVFEHVAPGEVAVARVEAVPRHMGFGTSILTVWGGCRLALVRVAPGETAHVEAGGFGQTVIGRLGTTNKFEACLATLRAELPPVPYPVDLAGEAKLHWVRDWFWSDAGAPWRIWLGGTPQPNNLLGPNFRPGVGGMFGSGESWAVKVEGNGSFRIDDVPAGTYRLEAVFYQPTVRGDNFARPTELGRITHRFTVEAGENLAARPALNLGLIGDQPAQPPTAQVNLDVPAPTPSEPVKAVMKLSPSEIKAGGQVEVMVQARIAGGYHLYATTSGDSPFTPVKLTLTLPEGLHADGDWVHSEPIRNRDGTLIYEHAVWFRRTVKVQADKPGPGLSIKATLQYQACNADLCFPAKTVELEASLAVKSTNHKE